MELHTFSSLTKEFLLEYKGAMDEADIAIVYFNPHTIAHKRLPPITPEQVYSSFGRKDIIICTDSNEVIEVIKSQKWENRNLLMMSSGNFDGISFEKLALEII